MEKKKSREYDEKQHCNKYNKHEGHLITEKDTELVTLMHLRIFAIALECKRKNRRMVFRNKKKRGREREKERKKRK